MKPHDYCFARFGKAYLTKSYTTEATTRVVEFASSQLKLSEIVGRYASENQKSANVMEKLGFEYPKNISYECNDGAFVRRGVQCKLIIGKEKDD